MRRPLLRHDRVAALSVCAICGELLCIASTFLGFGAGNLNDLVINKRTAKNGIGHMEAAGWANLIKILRDGGVLKADVDASKVFTNDYIPKDAPRW